MHLLTIEAEVEKFEPAVVVLDPITNFANVGDIIEVRQMLTRLVDCLKERGVLTLMTTYLSGDLGWGDARAGITVSVFTMRPSRMIATLPQVFSTSERM